MTAPIKVGDPVWIFDENRRVYGPDQSGPIYARYWTKTVIQEAPRGRKSLRAEHRRFVRDRNGVYRGHATHLAFSQADVDADIWVNTHRHGVRDLVQACKDVDKLKQIATILGYDDTGSSV